MDANVIASLNKACPALKRAKLGDFLTGVPHIQAVVVDSDASSGIDFTAEYSGDIVLVWAAASVTNTSGNLQVERDSVGLFDAADCAVIDTVSLSGAIVQDTKTLTKGETLSIVATGSDTRGTLYMLIL